MASPTIDGTKFGEITIAGRSYDYDVVIRLGGEVVKRKKKLSKRVYGTSHTVSKEEAEFLYEDGCARLIIGTGQYDSVRLSPKAEKYFASRGCRVDLAKTPDAVARFNEAKGSAAGMFHVTC